MRGRPTASRRRRRSRGSAARGGARGGVDEAASILARARAFRSSTAGPDDVRDAARGGRARRGDRAPIDPAGPLLDGTSGLAFQARGAEHGHAGRGARPGGGRRGVARRSAHDAPAAARAPPAAGRERDARRRRRAADGDRGAGRTFPRAPPRPRRRGAVDLRALVREDAVRATPARRSRPRGAAARLRQRGDPPPRARHVEALALHALVRDLARSRTSSPSRSATRATPPAPRTCSRGRPATRRR
jgi:hypothetical protein